jgi:hypothetical protein
MFNPHDVAADLLEAMADEAEYFLGALEAVLKDEEWADAFGWEDEPAANDEAAYWAAEDARHEAADAQIAAGLARLEEDGELTDEEEDLDHDPDPAAPAALPAGWWVTGLDRVRDRAGLAPVKVKPAELPNAA